MGRNAPRIDPNANSRMTSATVTPMASEDGGSPATNPNTPLAPTSIWASLPADLMMSSAATMSLAVQVVEGLALEHHGGERDGAIRAHARLAEVRQGRLRLRRRAAAAPRPDHPRLSCVGGLRRAARAQRLAEGSDHARDPRRRCDILQGLRHRRLGLVVSGGSRCRAPHDLTLQPSTSARTAPRQVGQQVLRCRRLGVRQLEVVVVVPAEPRAQEAEHDHQRNPAEQRVPRAAHRPLRHPTHLARLPRGVPAGRRPADAPKP